MLDSDLNFIITDERGWPKLSGIHDARLAKFSVNFGHALSFEAIGARDERRTFILDGLYLLKIDGDWEAVIVDSISVWDITRDFGEEADGEVARAWRGLLAGRIGPDEEAAEVRRLRRRHDRLSLVSLSCSYGGELKALCRDVSIDGRRVVAA